MRRWLGLAAVLLLAASCSGNDGGSDGGSNGGKDGGSDSPGGSDGSVATSASSTNTEPSPDPGTGMPAECVPAPYTVEAQRDGDKPAGSVTFGVVGSAALPIPLVPNKDESIPAPDVIAQGADTDLLGYVVFFGDEDFGTDAIGMFSGYEPEAVGKSRGTVSIFPVSPTPLAVGDVITPGPLDGLDMFTTLLSVNMDFKAAPDELTAYLTSLEGSVTILGLTDDAICIQADLSWEYSDFSSTGSGTLTLNGIFTAPLAPRSLPFT